MHLLVDQGRPRWVFMKNEVQNWDKLEPGGLESQSRDSASQRALYVTTILRPRSSRRSIVHKAWPKSLETVPEVTVDERTLTHIQRVQHCIRKLEVSSITRDSAMPP